MSDNVRYNSVSHEVLSKTIRPVPFEFIIATPVGIVWLSLGRGGAYECLIHLLIRLYKTRSRWRTSKAVFLRVGVANSP